MNPVPVFRPVGANEIEYLKNNAFEGWALLPEENQSVHLFYSLDDARVFAIDQYSGKQSSVFVTRFTVSKEFLQNYPGTAKECILQNGDIEVLNNSIIGEIAVVEEYRPHHEHY